MKLSADIVFDGISGRFPMEISGPRFSELRLERPIFYSDADMLKKDHLYITHTERLPRRTEIPQGVVLICVGDALRLSYYQERCCVIHLTGDTDVFSVFNAVQELYDRFDRWQAELQAILDGDANVDELLKCSLPVFDTSMFLMDANFHFLARAEANSTSDLRGAAQSESLSLEELQQYLEVNELVLQDTEPLVLNLLDTTTLNVNLFDHETYIGCLTIDYKKHRNRRGDVELAKVLASKLESALVRFASAEPTGYRLLRRVLSDVVDGIPIDYAQRRALENTSLGKMYFCVKMELSSRLSKLPLGYICNEVERRFPRSIAFERAGAAMCFLDAAFFGEGEEQQQAALANELRVFTESMDMRVGISDAFSNILSARLYYHQASAAIENGVLLDPDRKYYRFQDYALTELIVNSLGKMPAELFFSPGMHRLAEHDAESAVSYMDTLREYLNQNMSITRTSAALYVHRSTLMERIARIERDLDTDLSDPDVRLRILILLKAIWLQQELKERGKREKESS